MPLPSTESFQLAPASIYSVPASWVTFLSPIRIIVGAVSSRSLDKLSVVSSANGPESANPEFPPEFESVVVSRMNGSESECPDSEPLDALSVVSRANGSESANPESLPELESVVVSRLNGSESACPESEPLDALSEVSRANGSESANPSFSV